MLCRGKDRIPISEIQEIRKVSNRGAVAVQRMQALVNTETVRGDRKRPVCVRGRHWAANRMLELGKLSLDKKVEFGISVKLTVST